jgi:D-hydroxyproline dehydrogenase
MSEQDTIAVVGAGVIGAAVAYALAREGRNVLLLDAADPGEAGASFGNVGHIAAELVQPLPSPQLLFGFWKQLIRFGGVLDLPPRQALRMLPWIKSFAAAAFRRKENTRHLAPLVLPSSAIWSRWLEEIGQPDLLRRHGHYEVAFGAKGAKLMQAQARDMTVLGIKTQAVSADDLHALRQAAGADEAHGLWFKDSAHIIDPLNAVRTLAAAAVAQGARFQRLEVRRMQVRGERIEILSERSSLMVETAVVCAGMGSAPLLQAFGLNAPLQGVRGYHVELPHGVAFLDAPVVYTDSHLLVTPMTGRLRASSYMEFAAPDAPSDLRKAAQLRERVKAVGYPIAAQGPHWVGSRPILPDYLPGIGRAPGPAKLFYCIGHQHIGLTMAPMSAELVADLVAQRVPRHPVDAFDLRRFGTAAP